MFCVFSRARAKRARRQKNNLAFLETVRIFARFWPGLAGRDACLDRAAVQAVPKIGTRKTGIRWAVQIYKSEWRFLSLPKSNYVHIRHDLFATSFTAILFNLINLIFVLHFDRACMGNSWS